MNFLPSAAASVPTTAQRGFSVSQLIKNKYFVLLALLPLLAFRGGGDALVSTLSIPAGQQFQLGGGQLLGFKVVGKNVGPVAIQARELTSKGAVLERGTLAPGQKAELSFGAGSRALLLNNSTQEGTVKVVVTSFNPSNLSMGYDQAGK